MRELEERVLEIVCRVADVTPGRGEILFGPGGRLDSLGLVNLLADVEMAVSEEFGCEIVLASERAMSRQYSPFRTAEALAAFAAELVAEEQGRHQGDSEPAPGDP